MLVVSFSLLGKRHLSQHFKFERDISSKPNFILLIRGTPLGKAYVLGTFLTREVTDMGSRLHRGCAG